ncbi:hypothetical protein PICSAR21_04577 [Mycobacterium avium subsp. paratuberculosis]|nr:hypothetical protein PICSAR21_04577 [Mycobacterium avium subsp. paratuberculosis]CAG7192384.1 hypothetical protein PICSAR208_04571 [Mycobacterium avium subsp. paratuberculosis]
MDVQGLRAHVVYHAKDRSMFTVEMENTGQFAITSVRKNWPNAGWGDES